MPGYYDEDDFGQEQQSSGPKALREALDKAKQEKAALEAELATLRESNQTLANQVKTSTLRDALTDAGVDPKYARFAERDGVEATVESVQKWVDESKDVYAFLAPKAPAPQEPAAGDDSGDGDGAVQVDQLDPALVAGLLAGQNLESIGRPGGTTNVIDILAATDVSKFESAEQVDAYIRSLGAPTAG